MLRLWPENTHHSNRRRGGGLSSIQFFYDTLKLTTHSEISNVLVVWRSVLDQTSHDLEIGELLGKARSEYLGMVTLKTWSTNSRSNEPQIPKKSKQDRDISAILASSEEANAKISAMMKALTKASKKGYPAIVGNRDTKKSGPKHDWDKQFGEGKDFPTKSEFMTWLHEAPSSGKSTTKKNGLTWFWCNKCVRYTSHKSSECTKTTKREKIL